MMLYAFAKARRQTVVKGISDYLIKIGERAPAVPRQPRR
jgi:hypothetical protein